MKSVDSKNKKTKTEEWLIETGKGPGRWELQCGIFLPQPSTVAQHICDELTAFRLAIKHETEKPNGEKVMLHSSLSARLVGIPQRDRLGEMFDLIISVIVVDDQLCSFQTSVMGYKVSTREGKVIMPEYFGLVRPDFQPRHLVFWKDDELFRVIEPRPGRRFAIGGLKASFVGGWSKVEIVRATELRYANAEEITSRAWSSKYCRESLRNVSALGKGFS